MWVLCRCSGAMGGVWLVSRLPWNSNFGCPEDRPWSRPMNSLFAKLRQEQTQIYEDDRCLFEKEDSAVSSDPSEIRLQWKHSDSCCALQGQSAGPGAASGRCTCSKSIISLKHLEMLESGLARPPEIPMESNTMQIKLSSGNADQ